MVVFAFLLKITSFIAKFNFKADLQAVAVCITINNKT